MDYLIYFIDQHYPEFILTTERRFMTQVLKFKFKQRRKVFQLKVEGMKINKNELDNRR